MEYLSDSISDLYRKLLPSAIGSMLTATVASLIDSIILSFFLGPVMLSAVSICMPVYMLLNALALLIASGGTTLCAMHVGKKEFEESNRYFSLAAILTVIVGIILMVIGLGYTEEIVSLLGANEQIWDSTFAYAKVLMCFMLPLMLYSLMLFLVRFDSDPILALAATIICAVTNLVLDVLFVGPLKMGAGGAALATCLAYTLAMLVGFTHFLKKKNTLHLMRKSFSMERLIRIVKTGFPLSLSQFGMALTTSIFNVQIMRLAGELYVTVYAIITQLTMTAVAFYEGVAQAAQPILAANFGAKKKDRIKETVRKGIFWELVFTVGCMLIFIVGARIIAGFFSIREGELVDIALYGIRIYACSIPLTGLNMFGMYYFQSREKILPSTVISMLNGTILMIAGLFIMPAVIGINGIWWSWMFAQFVTLIVTGIFLKIDDSNERRG